jgi:hypothetical protein
VADGRLRISSYSGGRVVESTHGVRLSVKKFLMIIHLCWSNNPQDLASTPFQVVSLLHFRRCMSVFCAADRTSSGFMPSALRPIRADFYWSEHESDITGIATSFRLDGREVGVRVPVGASPLRPDRFWGPPGYRWLFPGGWSGRGKKMTTHLPLVPRSRAYLVKHRENFTFF